jgi:hypothetical protein
MGYRFISRCPITHLKVGRSLGHGFCQRIEIRITNAHPALCTAAINAKKKFAQE